MALKASRLGPVSVCAPPEGDAGWDMAYKVAVLVLTHKDHPERWMPIFGLPKFLFSSAVYCAQAFGSDEALANPELRWTTYMMLCMILVQGRDPGMTQAEVVGRVELEDILMEVLYG